DEDVPIDSPQAAACAFRWASGLDESTDVIPLAKWDIPAPYSTKDGHPVPLVGTGDRWQRDRGSGREMQFVNSGEAAVEHEADEEVRLRHGGQPGIVVRSRCVRRCFERARQRSKFKPERETLIGTCTLAVKGDGFVAPQQLADVERDADRVSTCSQSNPAGGLDLSPLA